MLPLCAARCPTWVDFQAVLLALLWWAGGCECCFGEKGFVSQLVVMESTSKSNIKQIVLNVMCHLNQTPRLKGNQTRPRLCCHYMVIFWGPINYTLLAGTGVTFSRLSRALSVLNEPCFLIWHDRCLIVLTFSGMHKQLRLQLFIHQRMQSYLMVLIYWRVLLNKS